MNQNETLREVCYGLAEVSHALQAEATTKEEVKEFERHARSFTAFGDLYDKWARNGREATVEHEFMMANHEHVFRTLSGEMCCLICGIHMTAKNGQEGNHGE